ncbi:MAG: NrfD/PsrC family molybdoenzyme membrane anchor subunit [Candidatus Korobacteraceae bacterium]|jgi:Ni/Fe-hydrogenase subunit HybB-like protein
MKFKFTFWKLVFAVIMVLGGYATVIRFTQGLGASTNMSDQYPWGIWIGFDVLCGVMLAAGGFTLTGAVHILNVKRLEPIVRPTVLTAFAGYLLVSVALMFDLGRPYRIWHPLVMRNPHSVMFEVAMCVMCYTTVLALEFSPIVLERFNLKKPLKFIKAALVPLVILGCILSTLHQSSLGTMYLIMPEKLHPFWYSPLLPVFFFISAIAVGLAMTIFESSLSSRVFGRQLELPIIQELGRILLVVLSVYAILRFEDLYHRGVLHQAFIPQYETYFFWLEIMMTVIVPLALLSIKKVRMSPGGLYFCAVVTLLGFITNRLNVSITGMEHWVGRHYIPSWMEFSVTASMVAGGFALFGLAVKYLPIFEDEHQHNPRQSAPEAPELVTPLSSTAVVTDAGD